MLDNTLFFHQEAKRLFKNFRNGDPQAQTRINKYVTGKDNICLARAQHVIAKETGFKNWTDLVHADPDRLLFAKIMYKNPLLTMINGWSAIGHKINPYREKDRTDLFDSYDTVIRIVSWIRGNEIGLPANTRDYMYLHTGTGKDAFSRLFEKIYQQPYQYMGVGIVTVAMMMCGFKPLNIDTTKGYPVPGQGRCWFAISKKGWAKANISYPSLKA